MSNLSELITNVNEADHTSLNIFGSMVGTIADFSGGIGLAVTAVQLVSSLISPDDTGKLPNDIRNTIQQGFAKLGLDIKDGELLREMNNTDLITKDAEGIYSTLKGTVTTGVDKNEVIRQISVCATAVNALSIRAHPEQWKVVHDDQSISHTLITASTTPAEHRVRSFNLWQELQTIIRLRCRTPSPVVV